MDLKDAIRVEFERVFREALHEMHRSLRVVLDPLEDWARDVIQRPLASDWREQLAAHLATWDAEGFRLADQSVPVLESWIEAWATYLAPMHARNAATFAGTQQQDHGFVISFAPNVSGPPNGQTAVKLSQQSSVMRDGVEVAGPGPETSESFRRKVQYALELLDPSVANWWKTPSVAGILRSRDASSGTQFWRWNYHSYLEGERPVVVVDRNFTAAQAAEAIVAESEQGYFADSVAVARRRFKAGRSDASKVLQEWQEAGLGDAAEMAGILAELLITSIATLTPAGDLVVTLADLIENGPSWDQLISVLPLIGKLPIVAVVIQVGAKKVRIPKSVALRLERLSESGRKRILASLVTAKTDDEAAAIAKREIARHADKAQVHHAISKSVHNELERHKNLKGRYQVRDKRFEVTAATAEAHRGYQAWHRDLDSEVVAWIRNNREVSQLEFESWLRKRYAKPDLIERFPDGFMNR